MKLPAIARLSVGLVLVVMSAGCTLLPAARQPSSDSPAGQQGPTATVDAAAPGSPGFGAPTDATKATLAATRDRPPDGLLTSAGSNVAGKLGTYCYRGTCLDIAQWPSKSELPLLTVTSARLTFELSGGTQFVGWTAAYGDKANGPETELGQGGSESDPDATSSAAEQLTKAIIDSPPAGDWVVWMFVRLEHGDLSYAWHVVVLPDTATE